MIHPHTEVRFIDASKGYGLFATENIPRGTITWVLDPLDREISQREMDSYEKIYQEILLKYSFRNSSGNYVFCWDNCRYINHSFNANCCLTPCNFEIATKDIQAGEEITDDYGYLNIIEPFEAESEDARTVVYPDDLLHYSDKWDKQIDATLPALLHVKQPLQKYLSSTVWESLLEVRRGRRALPSIRTCYYPG